MIRSDIVTMSGALSGNPSSVMPDPASPEPAANRLAITARALRRHLVTAMGISARMGADL
jgi:hypothetical protein